MQQHYMPMPTTVGEVKVPLGQTRLQIARLIAMLIMTGQDCIISELASLGTLSVIMVDALSIGNLCFFGDTVVICMYYTNSVRIKLNPIITLGSCSVKALISKSADSGLFFYISVVRISAPVDTDVGVDVLISFYVVLFRISIFFI